MKLLLVKYANYLQDMTKLEKKKPIIDLKLSWHHHVMGRVVVSSNWAHPWNAPTFLLSDWPISLSEVLQSSLPLINRDASPVAMIRLSHRPIRRLMWNQCSLDQSKAFIWTGTFPACTWHFTIRFYCAYTCRRRSRLLRNGTTVFLHGSKNP